MNAVADLWQRDIAELKRTKQAGGVGVVKKLRSGVKEIRADYPRRIKSKLP